MANKCSFSQWKKAVDAALMAKVGLSSQDLADWGYWSAYASGVSASAAANAALKADGYDMSFSWVSA